MPCYYLDEPNFSALQRDYEKMRSTAEKAILEAKDTQQQLNSLLKSTNDLLGIAQEQKVQLDQLTAWLCDIGRNARFGHMELDWIPPTGLLEWWEEHRKADLARGEPW